MHIMIVKEYAGDFHLHKICGFILFWLAVGMAIGMHMQSGFIVICLLIIMMMIGFNLFCKR